MKKCIAWGLLLALLLTGCVKPEQEAVTPTLSSKTDSQELFSRRDYETDYSESEAIHITLTGASAECGSPAVQISGSTVTLCDEGIYVLSGTLDDGTVIVNAEKEDKLQLVLSGVNIHSAASAPIYILQADKVFLTMAPNSVNALSNGGSFAAIDENNIDAVIFSKEDLTLNGSGSLQVVSPAGHGIVSKDSLTVTGGEYRIEAASHGLSGKDDVCIAGGVFALTAGKDGIHAENADDTARGFVYVEGGSFTMDAQGDGISASAYAELRGGSFAITAGGGSANAQKQTSDFGGGFMGGGRHPGGMGGFPGETGSQTDSTSCKGIKAAGDLKLFGGSYTIDAADDALHSNANLTVSGGEFTIATGDDGLHADETLTVTSGMISITESYEGLEGLHIAISGGEITLAASDDGLNAGGGNDGSGFGGFHGNDRFGGMGGGASSGGSIDISGGTIHVTASGDGIDANGTLTIRGGITTVCGPAQGDTATLDYDLSATITGGTFIGTGGAGMAQTFSDSGQGVIAVSAGSQRAGTQITLADQEGNTLLSYAPELPFGVVILSSPDMVKGETYRLTVGTASGEFQAS